MTVEGSWPTFNMYLPKLEGFAVHRGILEWTGEHQYLPCCGYILLDNNKIKNKIVSV